jgi:hypothetical protein
MEGGFELQLNSLAVLSPSLRTAVASPHGVRINPQLQLNLQDFFVNSGLEVGIARYHSTPMGVRYFDTDPSFYYAANAGYQIHQDWSVRVGRYHYEISDIDQLITSESYHIASTFASVTVPLGWFGGEFRFERERDEGVLLRSLLAAAFMQSDDGTPLGLFQGALTFAISEGDDPLQLSLAGNFSTRGSTVAESGLSDGKGETWGVGAATQLEMGIFSTVLSYQYRDGEYFKHLTSRFLETRSAMTTVLSLAPGKWRARASYSMLHQLVNEAPLEYAGTPENEHHWELHGGYYPLEGLLISLGYRGVRGKNNFKSDFLFLGFQTAFQKLLKFNDPPTNRSL